MKQYTFEYTDSKLLLILVGIFLLILISILALLRYIIPVTGVNLGAVIVLGLPALVVWLLRKRLKKNVVADLNSSFVNFDFGDRIENIAFKDLQS